VLGFFTFGGLFGASVYLTQLIIMFAGGTSRVPTQFFPFFFVPGPPSNLSWWGPTLRARGTLRFWAAIVASPLDARPPSVKVSDVFAKVRLTLLRLP